MLGNLFGVHLDLTPLISIWTPPGWDAYVGLIERALDLLAVTFNNAGVAVIIFTIIIKTLLLPLTVKSLRSSKAMQEVQPKIKELQKKYGKDRQRISQETMKLYAQHGVNPMAGCLPMVIQMPIFWGLYIAIRHLSAGNNVNASDFWSGGFLWLHSLADADPYKILPILAGVFQFIQTKMMRPADQGEAADPQQKMMNQMMNFMPLMVVVFGWQFDSGPVIYWVTQSAFSVVQQWFITGWGSMHNWIPGLPELPEHRRLGYRPPRPIEDVVVVSGEDGAPVKHGGIMGWVQSRMDEAQQQALHRREEGQGQSQSQPQSQRDGRSSNRPSSKASMKARAPEPEATEDEETGSEETAPARKRNTRTTSYQDRVDAAVNRPANLSSAPRSDDSEEAAVASSASTRAKARGPRRNGQTPTTNGHTQGPVVPRKSRPTRKERK
ncbi:MAG TPA: membrane protein insertase YidC [Thermomicrobiales bacterium]|nr:membrane protein insertase YidC [Thermomicrobiales bacterium]